jgi:hypothetical protein
LFAKERDLMTTIDDQRLVAELRSMFDETSAGVTPLVNRRAAVARRVTRHRRVQALSALSALLVLVGGIAGASGVVRHRTASVPPAVTPSPSIEPGGLPRYQEGGKLVASAAIDASQQSTGSLTFVADSWDMLIGESCAVLGTDMWLAIKINGHEKGRSGCSPAGGGGTFGGPFGQQEQFWRDLGVELGKPMTVSFEVGRQKTMAHPSPLAHVPATGLATVGVYDAIPFDQYPLPPRPEGWTPISSAQYEMDPSVHQIGQIGDFGTSGVESGLTVTLPKHLEIVISATSPGIVRVLIAGKPVLACGSYGWGQGCDGGLTHVGEEQLAGLVTGHTAVVSVQTEHFTVPNTVEVLVYGD